MFESVRLMLLRALAATRHEFSVPRGLEEQNCQCEPIRETYEPALIKHFHIHVQRSVSLTGTNLKSALINSGIFESIGTTFE